MKIPAYPAYTKFWVISLTMMVFSLSVNSTLYGQAKYPRGKLYLKNGVVVEGKDLRLNPESALMTVNGTTQTYAWEDIQQAMAKRGLAKRIGAGCSAGCVTLSLASYLATGGEIEVTDEYGYTETQHITFGSYLIGTALWGALFYGGGYLVGAALDTWQVVYFSPR